MIKPLLSLLFVALCYASAYPAAHAAGPLTFSVLTHYEMEGNAEILQAFAGGDFLVHTNSDRQSIDIVDIRQPDRPVTVASLAVPGEPTSVGVSPDGRWAMAVVYSSQPKAGHKPKDPRIPGVLALLDLREPLAPAIVSMIGIGHHPDSIAVTARGDTLYGIVAIENEPLVVVNGRVVYVEDPGHAGDISEPGYLQVIAIDPTRPQHYQVTNVVLPEALLVEHAMLFPSDPQPEYVALAKEGQVAAVSLQENNGIVLLEPSTGKITGAYSLGVVAERPADLEDDGVIRFDQSYPRDAVAQQALAGARCPDAITFSPDGNYLLSADEGEMNYTGGRGFSVWSLDGRLVWDDGGELERKAAELGLYPDKRSDARGIEVEGITAARFGSVDYVFALSERGSFLAIYTLDETGSAQFQQIIATEKAPESVVAIPSRNLVVVAAEQGGALTIVRAAERM